MVSVEIAIRDTGCGISKEGLKNLFSEFGKLEENAE
jgi:signal transduction histidine kinase